MRNKQVKNSEWTTEKEWQKRNILMGHTIIACMSIYCR